MGYNVYNNKTILITGGTGTIGSLLAKKILENYKPKKIVLISRDETRQHDLGIEINNNLVDFHLCDIRDLERLNEIFSYCKPDIVFHAAALKHVIFCEKNISEAIKTNLLGTQNVITSSINNNVEKVIYVSTDKAVNPTSVMGSTKLIGERLSIDSNKLSKTKISCVRFGNVLSSRGSVFQTFKKQIEKGKKLTITDVEMTRFVMTPSDAINLVLEAGNAAKGGEIFILKMPSMKIIDLAKAMCKYYGKENEIEIIGPKFGEKLYEELITETEAKYVSENKNMYMISSENDNKIINTLRSDDSKYILSEDQILEYIKKMLDNV